PRPPGPLVWLHGASVGEALSILPLIAALRRAAPGIGVLVTTGTVTSAARIAPELPSGALHQFVPVDTAAAVGRFLDHWRPDLAIWVESEFWPRLMTETARRGTPMLLVNARVSAASAARWRRLPGMARALVGLFARIVTQDAPTQARLVAMGADPGRVAEGGNLKMLAEPPGADAATLARLRAAIGARPVWLAASTHPPEEAIALAAHRLLAAQMPGLLTIVAPRHPDRGDALAGTLAAPGVRVARRARGALPDPETGIYLADTLGEMGLWLRLAPVAFIGGSLADRGGHNPFEPAALGVAILHGPHVANFAPAYAALTAAGGATVVADAATMAGAVARLLHDPAARAAQTAAAEAVLAQLRPDVAALAAQALALLRGRG
ncbi:MAG: glycosyltransferase N-terminal domain-containing protein, partial [Thermohalobaculum sp.]|nr:glycosyltransferase N-terminal domain-containing protein [Thermohalobaculum sp.]